MEISQSVEQSVILIGGTCLSFLAPAAPCNELKQIGAPDGNAGTVLNISEIRFQPIALIIAQLYCLVAGTERTTLKAGSSINITWHLAYPHKGGFRLEVGIGIGIGIGSSINITVSSILV